MSYRRRIYFTSEQKSEIWNRWQRGESMSSIGRLFDRDSSSIYPQKADVIRECLELRLLANT